MGVGNNRVYGVGRHEEALRRMWTVIAEARTDDPVARLGTLVNLDRGEVVSALLDAWAVAGDVLSFHQERIAAEARLETAERRRSLDLLARTVGYVPEQHLSATTTLAVTVDRKRAEEIRIPARTRFEAVAVDDNSPQIFETVRDVKVHARQNLMTPVFDPRPLTKHSTGAVFVGTDLGLSAGSWLVLFDEKNKANLRVMLTSVEERTAENHTVVTWGEALENLWKATWGEGDNAPKWPWGGGVPAPATITGPFNLFGREAPEWKTLPVAAKREYLRTSACVIENENANQIRDTLKNCIIAGNDSEKLKRFQDLVGKKLLPSLPTCLPDKVDNLGDDNDVRKILGCLSRALIDFFPVYYRDDNEWPNFGPLRPEISGDCPTAQPGAWVLIEARDGKIKMAAKIKARWIEHRHEFMQSETVTSLVLNDDTAPTPMPVLYRRVDRLFILGRKLDLAPMPDPRPLMVRGFPEDIRKEGLSGNEAWVTVKGLHPWLEPGGSLLACGFAPVAKFRKGTSLRPDDSGNRPQDRVLVRAVRPTKNAAAPNNDFTWRGGNPRLGHETVWWGSESDFEFEIPPSQDAEAAPSVWRRPVAVKLEVKKAVVHKDKEHTTIVFDDSPDTAVALAGLTLYGNLVEVINGETVKEELVVDRGRHTLARSPLAHHRSRPGTAPRPDIEFLDADGQKVTGHRVTAFSSGKAIVTFGDAAPDRLTATYRVSGGAAGNLPPSHVVNPPDGIPAITEVFQHLPALGGIGEPDPTDLRRRIPLAATDLGRLVTEEDFRTFALRFPGVTKADAFLDNRQVIVSIGMHDGPPANNDPLLGRLKTAMTQVMAKSPISNTDLSVEVLPCRIRRFALHVQVKYNSGFEADDVNDSIKHHLITLFGYSRRTIGGSVTYREIKEKLTSNPGIREIIVNRMHFEGENTSATSSVGIVANRQRKQIDLWSEVRNRILGKTIQPWFQEAVSNNIAHPQRPVLANIIAGATACIQPESYTDRLEQRVVASAKKFLVGMETLAANKDGLIKACRSQYVDDQVEILNRHVIIQPNNSVYRSVVAALLLAYECENRKLRIDSGGRFDYRSPKQVLDRLHLVIKFAEKIRETFVMGMTTAKFTTASLSVPSAVANRSTSDRIPSLFTYFLEVTNKTLADREFGQHKQDLMAMAYINSIFDHDMQTVASYKEAISAAHSLFRGDINTQSNALRSYITKIKGGVKKLISSSDDMKAIDGIISNYIEKIFICIISSFPRCLFDAAMPGILEDASFPLVKIARSLQENKEISDGVISTHKDEKPAQGDTRYLGADILVIDKNSINISNFSKAPKE